MVLEIGKIIRQIIQKNRDSTSNSRMYEIGFDEDEDSQEIQSYQQPGFQSRAPVDSNGIVGRISAAFKVLLGFDDKVPPVALEVGETIVYSSDGGAVACSMHLLKTGKVRLGNGTDEVVKIIYDLITELRKPVDLGGTASTGTLFKIDAALALLQTAIENLKA